MAIAVIPLNSLWMPCDRESRQKAGRSAAPVIAASRLATGPGPHRLSPAERSAIAARPELCPGNSIPTAPVRRAGYDDRHDSQQAHLATGFAFKWAFQHAPRIYCRKGTNNLNASHSQLLRLSHSGEKQYDHPRLRACEASGNFGPTYHDGRRREWSTASDPSALSAKKSHGKYERE